MVVKEAEALVQKFNDESTPKTDLPKIYADLDQLAVRIREFEIVEEENNRRRATGQPTMDKEDTGTQWKNMPI